MLALTRIYLIDIQVDANHGVRDDGGRGRSGDKWWLRDAVMQE